MTVPATSPQPVVPLARFQEARSPYAFWMTYHVNYRIAALLAWAAHRAGLTPNMVSWISLFVTLAGPTILILLVPGNRWIEGGILLLFFQLGYTCDCADGTLARTTRSGSRFGQLLDKLIDSIVMLALPPLLYFASAGRQPTEPFGETGILLITFLAILSRGLLATLLWLKEYVERDADRTVTDTRVRNLAYYVRRGIGQSTDTSLFYVVLGIAWVTGRFWWLMAAYSLWIMIVWCGYLGLTYRDLRRN